MPNSTIPAAPPQNGAQPPTLLDDSIGLRHLRRCFMHGKACTLIGQFESQQRKHDGAEEIPAAIDNPAIGGDHKKIFVAMAFRPNLDTFYEWSLKNYLIGGIQNITEKDIARADEYRNIGYVMCEKVCRRIQAASLVVVDISTLNQNVYYEFGLAAGLGKQLLITYCQKEGDGTPKTEKELASIAEQTGFDADKVLVYPNVGYIDRAQKPLSNHLQHLNPRPLTHGMKVTRLLSGTQFPARNGNQPPDDDITVSFPQVLDAALGVALKEMLIDWDNRYDQAKKEKETADKLRKEDATRNARIRRAEATIESIEAYRGAIKSLQESLNVPPEDGGKPQSKDDAPPRRRVLLSDLKQGSYKNVSQSVDSSFACVIDLGGEKPISYFWLGYCHARGINVIPIYHELDAPNKPPAVECTHPENSPELRVTFGGKAEQKTERHVLAFDIRALWYIDHRHREPHKLAPLVKGVLELLIARDVPRYERNRFWERLTHGQNVHIFTGAVHSKQPEREMVGDWDLRTVSELVRSLASTHESVIPVLEPPISSPRASGNIKDYVDHLSNLLAGKNCLIIASADVNPMTEIALGKAYGVLEKCFLQPQDEDAPVIALKGRPSEGQQKEEDLCPTYFSRLHQRIQEGKRGFRVRGRGILQETYYSQHDAAKRKESFSVLAHLVLVKNSFEGTNNVHPGGYIVILGGVSGPATFGLAEVLTGGTSGNSVVAEQLLKQINAKWDRHQKDDDFVGIEAILKVEITSNPSDPNRFADVRSVTGWSLVEARTGESVSKITK